MSSVHYKFKATLEYKTLTFDGLHIGVDELKKAICDKENIRTESFDLLLTNAHTKREYTTGELVPRNSSVVVQRLPRDNAIKLPKVQDTTNSGIVQRTSGAFLSSTYISPDDFSKLTEEQRIAHIKQVSTEKYSAANYQKRPTGIMSGPPPPTYVCNRCAQPGHWYKSCPLVNTKRTTGIPMDELMETTKDDPLAMLHPSGKFVKSIMHFQARLQRKHEPFPGRADDVTGSPYAEEQSVDVPDQYKCFLCKGLLRDAVLAACCGHSFCAECYQQQLLANPTERCPGPDCSQQISADSLIPNKSLRSAIQKYLNELKTGGESTEQSCGVNKPSVLTDTQSLLHKLMPDLAYAQAQRELATTAGRSPPQQDSSQSSVITTTNMPVSLAQPTSKPAPIFIGLNSSSISTPISSASAIVTTQANVNVSTLSSQVPLTSTVSTATSLHGTPLFLPKIPIFDPNRPPPPINIPLSVAQSVAITPPIISSSVNMTAENGSIAHVTTSISTAQQKGLVSASPLSAQELSSVWENFLKRKDKDSTTKSSAITTSTSSTRPSMQNDQTETVVQTQQRPTLGTGGIDIDLRPPGSVTPVTGIVPPGIVHDQPNLLGNAIPSNLISNIGGIRPMNPSIASNIPYQSAIRNIGPHVPDNEITQVWLSFLRMKDSQQQQNRQYKTRYSISPERRTPSPPDHFPQRSSRMTGAFRRSKPYFNPRHRYVDEHKTKEERSGEKDERRGKKPRKEEREHRKEEKEHRKEEKGEKKEDRRKENGSKKEEKKKDREEKKKERKMENEEKNVRKLEIEAKVEKKMEDEAKDEKKMLDEAKDEKKMEDEEKIEGKMDVEKKIEEKDIQEKFEKKDTEEKVEKKDIEDKEKKLESEEKVKAKMESDDKKEERRKRKIGDEVKKKDKLEKKGDNKEEKEKEDKKEEDNKEEVKEERGIKIDGEEKIDEEDSRRKKKKKNKKKKKEREKEMGEEGDKKKRKKERKSKKKEKKDKKDKKNEEKREKGERKRGHKKDKKDDEERGKKKRKKEEHRHDEKERGGRKRSKKEDKEGKNLNE